MAVFPIIKGQKANNRHAIPPRASLSGPSSQPPQFEDAGGDLIDFGQNDSLAPAAKDLQANSVAHAAPTQSQGIGDMLQSTRKPAAEESLIDFDP